MASFDDHYRTLGVHRHAESAVIEAAYRAMARRYHPDVNRGDSAANERLQRINAAYAVLSDPARRQTYDHRWDVHHEKIAPPVKKRPSVPRTQASSPPPPKTPPTRSASRRPKERSGRPWWVNILGIAALILILWNVPSYLATSKDSARIAGMRQPTRVPTWSATRSPAKGAPTAIALTRPTTAMKTEATEHPGLLSGRDAWGFVDSFQAANTYQGRKTEQSTTYVTDKGFVIDITAPGGLDGVVYQDMPTGSRDYAFFLDLGPPQVGDKSPST